MILGGTIAAARADDDPATPLPRRAEVVAVLETGTNATAIRAVESRTGVKASTAATAGQLGLPRALRPEGGGEPTGAAIAALRGVNTDTRELMKILQIPDESRFQVSGWIQNSFTGNANGRPHDGLNFGVNPNNLADQWMGNQYYLILERVT